MHKHFFIGQTGTTAYDICNTSGKIIIPKNSKVKIVGYSEFNTLITLNLQELKTKKEVSTNFEAIILD